MATGPTTTTTAADLLFAEWVSAFIVPNLYAFTAAIPFSREEDMNGKPSISVRWPQAPEFTSGDLTEGTDVDPTEIDVQNSVSATLEEVGLAIELTDLLLESDILSSADWYSRQMLQAQEVKVDGDTTALYPGFSNSVGPLEFGGIEDDFLAAINTLEQENAPKPYVCVAASKFIGALRSDLADRGNAALFGSVQDIQGQTAQYGPVNAGKAFAHFGVDIYNDNTVPTVDTGANFANAMYSTDFALAYAHKWQNRVELQRRAVGRSTAVVLSTVKSEAELKDEAGVQIVEAAV